MEDGRIVALFFARDETALREADAAYGARLRALARRITGSAEDAEECVSDTYLRAWESVPPQRPRRLFAYLAAICRNAALDRVERAQAHKRSAELVALTEELAACVPDRRQEQTVSEETLTRLLETFLRAETADSRPIFLRRYWFGESVAGIAAALGMSENAVKLRLLRSRERLKRHLEKEGIEL